MSIWKSIGKAASNVASGFVDSLGGGLAGSAIGMVDNYFQNKQNEKNWQKQTSWQEKMTKQQNEFNANEALLNRQFNASEAEKARQFNASEAEKAHQRNIDLFNMENQHNSPKEQLRRMREAGMNPALMNGGSLVAASASSASAASGSAASGSAASGSAPSTPTLQNPLSIAQYRLMNEQAQSLALDNRDKRNDLNAKEELKDAPFDTFTYEHNPDGSVNYIVDVSPKKNAYQEAREYNRQMYYSQKMSNDEKDILMGVLRDTKHLLVQGKQKEYDKLVKELSLLTKEDNIKAREEKLAEFGIKSGSDAFSNLFSILLTSPENGAKLLNALSEASYLLFKQNFTDLSKLPARLEELLYGHR